MSINLKAKKPDLDMPIRSKIIVYSQSKFGKSPVLACVPNAVIFDIEKGMRRYKKQILENNSVVLESTDIEEITEEILKLQGGEHEYSTIIIDSLSRLRDINGEIWFRKCKQDLKEEIKTINKDFYRRKKERDYNMNNFGFKYWNNHYGELKRLQALLGSSGKIDMNVIVVAYEKITEPEDVKPYTTDVIIRPALPKESEYNYDYCVRLYKVAGDKKTKEGYTPSYASVVGKGEPIKDFTWNIENFRKYILTDLSQSKPKELASKETIGFILENKEHAINSDQEARWLAKLDIREWNELPKEEGEKIKAYIEKKIEEKVKKDKKDEAESKRLEEEDINM
jgi:hypothetical protein